MKPESTARDVNEQICVAAFRNNPTSIVVSRLSDGRIIEVNSMFTQISGYSVEESIGKTPIELNLWESQEEREAMIEAVEKDGWMAPRECAFLRRDGGRWIGAMSAERVEIDGEACILTNTLDVTDLRRTEARLSVVSDAMENALNGFEILSADGRFVYANRAAVEMWGYDSAEEFCQSSPQSHCLDPETPGRVIGELKKSGSTTREFVATRKDGAEFDALIYARQATDELNNEIYICTCLDVTERKRAEKQLLEEKQRLEEENTLLRSDFEAEHGWGNLVTASPAMKAVQKQASQVAKTDSTVLILGETGVGKEVLASEIHRNSRRAERPIVILNCAAIPATLVEAELFGAEKGAYTGADRARKGRFELADGGTLFLDEVGELPEEMQAKLLRALQEGQFERLGSAETTTVDVRVIAATNRELEKEVREGKFREDLFYRLSVFPITLPPLRERPEDIPVLAQLFVENLGDRIGKKFKSIARRGLETLQNYRWPGNIRELRNTIERAMIQSNGKTLQIEAPGKRSVGPVGGQRSLAEMERAHIVAVLEQTRWRVRGAGAAAEILGLCPTTLESRMKKSGIERPK
ncbi:MAG: PAS domain S-box-containing protein [Verrucomicrobiales bacterium]|jgi:PAS domain S-box-containing protein